MRSLRRISGSPCGPIAENSYKINRLSDQGHRDQRGTLSDIIAITSRARGTSVGENVVHASAPDEDPEREIKFFFNEKELFEY